MKTLGLAIAFAGFLFSAAAPVEMSRNHTTLDPHGSVSALVTSGIYRFSWNPIYLGFVCMMIGIPLYFNSYWGIIVTPVLVILFNRLVIEQEEAYLQKKFRDAYAGYRSRVRRWL